MSLTLADGSRVIAHMRGGQIMRAEAFSSSGRKLPMRYETVFAGPDLMQPVCYVWYCKRYPDGTERCIKFPIVCPDWLTFPEEVKD